MQGKIFIVLLLCAAAVLLAGCTQSQSPGTPTTTTPVPTTTTANPPAITQPTVTVAPDYTRGPMPQDKSVSVSVDRNTVNPNITVTYRGGAGINFVSTMEVVLSRSDGILARESIRKPQVNDQITMEGTKEVSESKADRIMVFVTLVNGDKYLIYDQSIPYKSRG